MSRRLLLLVVALCGVVPLAAPVAAHAAAAATCQADGNHVALVVDFGDRVDAQCIAISPRETGYQVLGDRARINGSGLVCAIDGVPASGCGEQTSDGHYAYWSYWHGTAADGWTYSSTSPSTRVSASIVEGWRWTPNGSANPSDPHPNWSADPSSTCATSTTTTATATAPPPVPDESPVTSAAPVTTAPAAPSASESPSTTTTVPVTSAAVATSMSSSSSEVAIARVNGGSGRGSGSPVGVVVGGGLVAALGAGAIALNRRRAASGP